MNKLINDIVRLDVLKEEIEYYKTLLQEHDTGHIHTTIGFFGGVSKNYRGRRLGR